MSINPPRLAIFGDSHYACLRRAQTEGLVDLSGLEIEYWGHVGRRFRYLEFRDGAIHPTDDMTATRFAKFNEKGRRFLPAADFDYVFFMGCRIDVSSVFIAMLDALMRGQYLSLGLRRAMLRRKLDTLYAYAWAKQMAALGLARIVLHPVSLWGLGAPHFDAVISDPLRRATSQARSEVWQFIADEMAQDQVTLLAQPDHTIAQGIYTDPIHNTVNSLGEVDYCHRSAAYGAIIYQLLLDQIRR